MNDLPAALLNRCDDCRVVVPQSRAHLPGREIQNGPTVGAINIGAGGPFDKQRKEVTTVTNHVALDGIAEILLALRLGVCLFAFLSIDLAFTFRTFHCDLW